jgi:hypothetical protein
VFSSRLFSLCISCAEALIGFRARSERVPSQTRSQKMLDFPSLVPRQRGGESVTREWSCGARSHVAIIQVHNTRELDFITKLISLMLLRSLNQRSSKMSTHVAKTPPPTNLPCQKYWTSLRSECKNCKDKMKCSMYLTHWKKHQKLMRK